MIEIFVERQPTIYGEVVTERLHADANGILRYHTFDFTEEETLTPDRAAARWPEHADRIRHIWAAMARRCAAGPRG